MSRPLGFTRRSTHGRGPLRHAMTWRRRTRTGRTYEAWCGAGVYQAPSQEGDFDPEHPRACPRCVAALKEYRG